MLTAKSSLVGESQAIQEILRTIEKVATTESTVLITGESGTGKELIARAIHEKVSAACFYLERAQRGVSGCF